MICPPHLCLPHNRVTALRRSTRSENEMDLVYLADLQSRVLRSQEVFCLSVCILTNVTLSCFVLAAVLVFPLCFCDGQSVDSS